MGEGRVGGRGVYGGGACMGDRRVAVGMCVCVW